jgi:NADPH-dependent 2,4-dienoyl-CoA reductase/sulfur reductase-like enzyme
MTKPAIVIGEDIPQVLQKLKHDLEAKYSDHYRLIEANSGQQALDCLKQMSLQNEPVALLLVDAQMHEKPFYDLIIIGSGPAGLAAGVYGASEGLRTLKP